MMQSNTELSPQFKARAAGALWWLCIISGMVGFLFGAPLIVANDATATATNILAKESLFRLGFVADLISGLSYVGVTAFIYYLLRPVSRSLSLVERSLAWLEWRLERLVVIHLTPLLLLRGDQYLTAFTRVSYKQCRWPRSNFRCRSSYWHGIFGFSASRLGTLLRDRSFCPHTRRTLGHRRTCYVIVSFANFVAPSFGPHLLPFLMPVALIGEGLLSGCFSSKA